MLYERIRVRSDLVTSTFNKYSLILNKMGTVPSRPQSVEMGLFQALHPELPINIKKCKNKIIILIDRNDKNQ
jgi:hypothetical protein